MDLSYLFSNSRLICTKIKAHTTATIMLKNLSIELELVEKKLLTTPEIIKALAVS